MSFPGEIKTVVTGHEAICSLGHTADEIWKNISQSKSGVKKLNNRFDHEPGDFPYPVGIASYIENFKISEEILNLKEQDRFDLFTHYALHTIAGLIKKSGLKIDTDYPASRVGCILGVGMGGFPFIGNGHAEYLKKKKARLNPFFIPSIIPNMATGLAAMKFGFKGTNFTVSSACASSGHAIEIGKQLIESGSLDAVIVGGAEAVITKFTLTGFHSMKALSSRDIDPQLASCPFDRERDGFVMGEGAGVLLLENKDKAIKRKASICAELIGAASSCDAHHISAPHPEGHGAAQSMAEAINQAGIFPKDIDYINAHGTSTPRGDIAETMAIKTVFKEHSQNLSISSTKSMTGHLLGAASGLESVICLKALENQIVPPTINLNNPSKECDLDYTPNQAKEKKLQYVMNNSFGFGGTNSTLIFKGSKK